MNLFICLTILVAMYSAAIASAVLCWMVTAIRAIAKMVESSFLQTSLETFTELKQGEMCLFRVSLITCPCRRSNKNCKTKLFITGQLPVRPF